MKDGNTQLRTYARIAGAGGLIVFLIYMFVVVFPLLLASEANPKLTSDASLLGFLGLGYLFAWHRAQEGGIMLMFISAVAGLSYYYNQSEIHPGIIIGTCTPLFISGSLFYFYHRSLKKSG